MGTTPEQFAVSCHRILKDDPGSDRLIGIEGTNMDEVRRLALEAVTG